MINKVIILAAGNGKRMEESSPPAERETPKPLRKLLGISIIEWTVRRMKDLELDVYVVIRPNDEGKFNEALNKYGVHYIYENQPLGTAHALYSAKNVIFDDFFLVVMGDDISNISKDNLVDSPAIFVQETRDISAFGSVVVGKDSLVINIREKEDRGEGLANTGIYIMPKFFFNTFPGVRARENGEYYLTDALIAMVKQGVSIKVLPIGYWKPINNNKDLLEAERELSIFNYTEICIRPAKEKDFHDLTKLLAELSTTNEKDLSKSFDPKESFRKVLSNRNEFILVSSFNGRVVSSVTLIIQDNISHGGRPYCHIENVVTDQEYRKKGIALLNLGFAITLAKISSCYKAILNCRPELMDFYTKGGFRINDEIEMRRDLD